MRSQENICKECVELWNGVPVGMVEGQDKALGAAESGKSRGQRMDRATQRDGAFPSLIPASL